MDGRRMTMRMAAATAALATLLTGGCATRTSRIEAALVKAGVSTRLSACLAPRLAERLSNDQLRRVAEAAGRRPGEAGRVSPREIAARVAGLGDPEIVDAITASAVHCALKG